MRSWKSSSSSGAGCGPLFVLVGILLSAWTGTLHGPAAVRAWSQGQQGPTVTFKVAVNHVEIPAVVVDAHGHFVEGLRQSDFEVYEDGKRQTISTFDLVSLPVPRAEPSLSAKESVQYDVQTNGQPFEGRLYVLLLDDVNIDAANTAPTRRLAKRFVETQVGAGDLAAVVCSGGCSGAQDFTTDRRLLVAAIDRFMGRGDSSSSGGSPLPGRPGGDAGGDGRYNARVTLATIVNISNALAAIGGRRKALVLFSEGITAVDPMNLGAQRGESNTDLAAAITAAVRANVTIYALDPAGLKLAGGRADVTPPIDDTFSSGFEGVQEAMGLKLETLRRLSFDTGGFMAINTNNLVPALERIGEDNRRYYLLGYEPSADRRDGKFHRIDLKVSVSGVEVRAREGYVAARPEVTPSSAEPGPGPTKEPLPLAVQEVLDDPLPVSGVRLSAFAAPFKGTSQAASVTIVVQIDGRDLGFKEVDGRFEGGLALAILATDGEGKTKNSLTKTIALPLRAESHRQMVANGLRLVEHLDLPRGRVRLCIAVQDVESQRVGSVHYDLDVPDFDALPLAMSGLVLTSSLAGRVPSAPSECLEMFRARLPGPPTVTRVFARKETLALTADIYGRAPMPHDVVVVTMVSNASGDQVYRHEDRRLVTDVSKDEAACRYTAMVPLARLTPGLYVLTVEARSELNPTLLSRRDVSFQVDVTKDPSR